MPSMSGSGEVNLWVFALRSRKSHTTRRRGGTPFTPVPGFVSSSIGEVLRAFVMRHRGHGTCTMIEGMNLLSRIGIPDAQGRVRGSRNEVRRRQTEQSDEGNVPPQNVSARPSSEIPDASGVVHRSRIRLMAVDVEHNAVD